MAGLISRASLIVKAKFSKLLNRAENPTETLDYSYEQMQTQLQNVKRGVADVVTAKKRLEIQTQKVEQNVVKLETQARQALAANREDLARQALEKKAAAQLQLQGLDEQVKQLQTQQDNLVAGQQTLETRIEGFRSQKEVLKAQYSAAEAQVKIGEAATGIGRGMQDTGLAIQRAKEKTEELQARASAIDELTSTGALEDFTAGDQTQLDRELAQISTTGQVDSDVEELLQSVAAGSGSTLDRKKDTFGFEWVVVRDPDLEDQVTAVHAVASELQARGFGGQLLAAAFRFDGGAEPVYWIYGFKTGTFWPFVPTGEKQQRDNPRELELKAKLEKELPVEPDLTKWLALYDAPI